MDHTLRRLTVAEFHFLAPELVDIYLDAMGYPAAMREQRIKVWRHECGFPGFASVIATEAAVSNRSVPLPPTPQRPNTEYIVGLAYGFTGNPGTWWHRQVARGLRPRGRLDLLSDYFEIAEVHVDPRRQSHGLGHRLLTELLTGRPESLALLSTPEVPGEDNAAFRLYRGHGFRDVLRHFRFDGDARPFAVLGTDLPPA